jgi:hypothetical protein
MTTDKKKKAPSTLLVAPRSLRTFAHHSFFLLLLCAGKKGLDAASAVVYKTSFCLLTRLL